MKFVKTIAASATVAALGLALVASAASYTFSNYLSVGSTGADVTALQNWLIAEGFSIPAISSGAAQPGYFGSQTQAAVEAYQFSVGIPNTGFVGPLTVAALNKGETASMSSTGTTVAMTCPAGFVCTPIAGTTTTTTTSTTAPTSITTPGVSGTLTIASSGSVAIGATVNDGQVANIAGFKLQAGPSDMEVNTITADFNVRPWLYFSSFSLVNQSTGQTIIGPLPISQSSFTEITASQDYRYTLSGLNFVVPHGQTVNIVLSAQVLSGTGKSQGYINIIAATVRSVDGTGVVDTENLPTLGAPYISQSGSPSPEGSVYYSGSLTANLIPSIDPTSPSAQIIQTQTGSVTNGVPLAVYDIQSQNNSATLQGLTLNIGINGSTTATPASVFNTIELEANGQTYYGTLSGTGTNGAYVTNGSTTAGTVTFNSNVNIPLPIGVTVPLKIIGNISQGITGITASTSLVSSVAGNFTGVDANYNNPTIQPVGTIASAVTTFSTTAAFSVTAGPAPTLTQVSYTGAAVQGTYTAATWPFTFTVSSGSSPIYISATPGAAVKIGTDLAGITGPIGGGGAASTTEAVGISSPNVTGDTNGGFGASATGSYYVPSNSSRTFTLTVIQNNAGNPTDGSAVVGLTGVYYSSSATTAGNTTATSSETLYTLPSSVNSPTVSLVGH